MIITIDGSSGTGKTTVARHVAERLRFVYFDTGAMYRAFTWFVLEHNVDIKDAPAIELLLKNFHFNVREDEAGKHYLVNERDVTEVIRSRLITARVSAVSALPQVRSALLGIQHEFGERQNAVFEGRDLGTVVFPQAEVKIFLTADPRIRAERRLQEMVVKKSADVEGIDRNVVLVDILERDRLDSSRELAPLRCPEGAFTIDTTQLSIDEVVDSIVKYCAKLYPQLISL